MKDRIKIFCAQLLSAKDPRAIQAIKVELRAAIQEHIERLQQKILAYPAVWVRISPD